MDKDPVCLVADAARSWLVSKSICLTGESGRSSFSFNSRGADRTTSFIEVMRCVSRIVMER